MADDRWRRHQLAEEVPGLYIRRLTLEDPRRAREPSSSRSQSPARHICHPAAGYVPSSRRSSSYRSWLERIRKDRPPFLTIVSLELPDSPIPLIESQASTRSKSVETSQSAESKDDVLDELLGKVTANDEGGRKREPRGGRKRSSRKYRGGRERGEELVECTKGVPTLEECTKNIVEGPSRRRLLELDLHAIADCICSEMLENCRSNVEQRESRASRSPSPEITRIIRIAMNYRDRLNCGDGAVEPEKNGGSRPEAAARDAQVKKEILKEDGCCSNENDALDFALNCCSVQLTARGTSAKAAAVGGPGGSQQASETRTYYSVPVFPVNPYVRKL